MQMYKRIIAVILLCITTILPFTFNNLNTKASALDSGPIVETPDFRPSFSDINIDINDSLTISYEDIDINEYECSLSADGINATIIEDNGYLQCEIEAISNVEFGTLTVNAIAIDGTEFTNTIYTYNNGEKLFYSEFAKDQAWFDGTKELYEKGLDGFTYKHWEEEYSKLMSSILSGTPTIISSNNNSTKVSGNIEWEADKYHTPLSLRNAYVEIIAKNNYDYITLDSDYTDAAGNYDLEISNNVFSQYSDIYFRISLEAYTFKVRSGWHTFAYYFDKKLSEEINAGDIIDFSPDILCDTSLKIYKATYVHQSMVIAERFAKEMGFETTNKIRVAYPAGIETNKEDWALSGSAFCWGDVIDNCYCAIGWHNYNNINTAVHEYSHYIQCSLGNYGEPLHEILLETPTHDGTGDYYTQKGDKSFAMHLVWTEGWGYAFAAMAQKYYQSEYYPLTLNYSYITSISNADDDSYLGEFQEKSMQAFLWSLVEPTKSKWNIGVANPTLDYQIPWTPQEWWNMTTVSGTCRLPDFIDLIETESYNLGVNLDYKQIKKEVAEKLTKYNIAPEITSVTFVNGDVTKGPDIRFKPNGSIDHPNNKAVIKIYDENNNLLAETSEMAFYSERFNVYILSVPQSVWNQVMAQWQCKPIGTTKFNFSIEGYRDEYDDDEFSKSGPYASKYFDKDITVPHNLQCTSISETSHAEKCLDCLYQKNSTSHTWGYRIINNQRHEKYCLDCGYSAGTSLHVLKATDDDRYKRCTICGIWVDTGLNDIFPIQGLPPKDPEEETE